MLLNEKAKEMFNMAKSKNLTIRNSSSRLWIYIVPEELCICKWNVNMA